MFIMLVQAGRRRRGHRHVDRRVQAACRATERIPLGIWSRRPVDDREPLSAATRAGHQSLRIEPPALDLLEREPRLLSRKRKLTLGCHSMPLEGDQCVTLDVEALE